MQKKSADQMGIVGIGVISGRGRGRDAHTGEDRAPVREMSGVSVCPVDPGLLKDRDALGAMRRADPFSKMAVLAAYDACRDAGYAAGATDPVTAIIVTTAFGPHRVTFSYLDEILDYGDLEVSPTRFSHTVHNAAASYVAAALDCRGPVCTITDFHAPLYAGVLTAGLWLREGRCARALVGYVEEASAPMSYAIAEKRAATGGASLQPFHFTTRPEVLVSEGGVFLALELNVPSAPAIEWHPLSREHPIADVSSLLRYEAAQRAHTE